MVWTDDGGGGNLLRLIRGEADTLTGRYLTYEDDLTALAAATGGS
ncbi:hypothetical protein [Streptomyces sp. NPDC059010]